MKRKETIQQRLLDRKRMDWSEGNRDFIEGYVFALEWVLGYQDGEDTEESGMPFDDWWLCPRCHELTEIDNKESRTRTCLACDWEVTIPDPEQFIDD